MKDNEFMIMRHSYDDHSYIDGKNDTSLTTKGIEIAKSASDYILQKLENKKTIIRYSVKKRAKETAEILGEKLHKNNIELRLIEDNGLTELFQGKFDFNGMSHIERVNFLQSCWDDFEFCREYGDLKHKFGAYKDKKVILSPGENHQTWSARVGSAVLNILNDIQNKNQSINITHRGATLEIQKIIEMANGNICIDDVEKYKTIRMNYCQDYVLQLYNINDAKKRTEEFIKERMM